MISKGDRTKGYIKQQARRIFAAKGFSSVTMQDICEACELSRGGLYRHYVSTGEILCSILADDEEDALASLKDAVEKQISASTVFHTFLQNRIHAVTDPETSIENAVAEFVIQDKKGRYMLCRRGETSIKILTKIIEQGVSEGDFHCSDPISIAKQVLWLIEGMSMHSRIMPLSQDEISAQIGLIENLLYIKRGVEP